MQTFSTFAAAALVFAFVIGCFAWVTALPTLGFLYLVGAL